MSSNVQLRIHVPFEQKDAAKALGARWLPAEKTWYVPHGIDVNLFSRWWSTDLKTAHKEPQPRDANASTKRARTSRPSVKSSPNTQRGFVTGPETIAIEGSPKLPWDE